MADDRKTEAPTRRRLEQARERGQVPLSKEIVSFFMLLCYMVLFAWTLEPFSHEILKVMLELVESLPRDVRNDSILSIVGSTILKPLMIPMVLILIFSMIGHVVQRGFVFSSYPLRPSFDKVSLLKGLKKIFSFNSFFELFNSILKLLVIGTAIFIVIKPNLVSVLHLYDYEVSQIMEFANTLVISVLLSVSIVMILVASIDLFYKRFKHVQDLKMTKEELKDEMKQQELSPEVRSKLKKIRAERVKHHIMMSAVKDSDVVIVNPEHYAVALKYDPKAMPSPQVVAKGKGYIALSIKKAAYENGVIVLENKLLARSLYQSVGLGEFIPAMHYRAVAEVINYVYRLRRNKTQKQAFS